MTTRRWPKQCVGPGDRYVAAGNWPAWAGVAHFVPVFCFFLFVCFCLRILTDFISGYF